MILSKKASIIIPLNHRIERTSDHYRQTISILKKQYFVLAYHHYREPIKLYRILNKKNRSLKFIEKSKNKNIFHLRPIYILPFNRFSFIKKINEYFSLLSIYLFNLNIKKNKINNIIYYDLLDY